MTYDQRFYDLIRPGVQSSASVVVPLVVDMLQLGHGNGLSVVDVGCGEGWWAKTFADHGYSVLGIDGPWVDGKRAGIPFYVHDLNQPLPDDLGKFDLAVSLEVAEHLQPERAASFIGDLCTIADMVLFSAAIPGQGGAGHVNEQPPSYWARLFHSQGYMVSGALRWMLWDDHRVENWYRQNLLVAVRSDWHPRDAYPDLFDTPEAMPLHLVHPILFNDRMAR